MDYWSGLQFGLIVQFLVWTIRSSVPELTPDLASRGAIEVQKGDIVTVLIDGTRWPCHGVGGEYVGRGDLLVLEKVDC